MIKKISILGLVASLTFVSCDKKAKTSDTVDSIDSTTVKTDSTTTKTDSIATTTEKTTEVIPFTETKGYFVKNTFKGDYFAEAKIATQAEFDKLFGAAAVMGANGKPTAIDFAKQYVIAVTDKTSDIETTLTSKSLTKEGDVIKFNYDIKRGAKSSATMKPLLMILVDKKHEGKVEVEGSEVK